MAFTAQDLLENGLAPVCVAVDDPVQKALELMVENDFSQLPIVDTEYRPLGLVTSDSILRGLSYFRSTIDHLRVRDVAENAKQYHQEVGVFDLLDGLNDRPAVLIVDNENRLSGIVTSWDTTAYFRQRSETLMLVEDIETALEEHIQAAFTNSSTGEIDAQLQQEAIDTVSNALIYSNSKTALGKYLRLMGNDHQLNLEWLVQACASLVGAPKKVSDLSLYQKIELLLHKSVWPQYSANFSMDDKAVRQLFEGVYRTRNVLTHFREEITQAQHDQLRFCVRWLDQNPPVFPEGNTLTTVSETDVPPVTNEILPIDEEITEKDSRYALLAIYLQNLPLRHDKFVMSFDELETIIDSSLPPSAYRHRSWWANDSVSHVQSIQWLEAGWRVSYINFTEKKVTFVRIRERERAYIDFFNQLMHELKAVADFQVRESSPMGVNWINVLHLPRDGNGQPGQIALSFAQGRRFRVELYIDTLDQDKNKQVFDLLKSQRSEIEGHLGAEITWERLDGKRASRIAHYYSDISITDSPDKLARLRKWAVESMIKFERAIVERAESAFEMTT